MSEEFVVNDKRLFNQNGQIKTEMDVEPVNEPITESTGGSDGKIASAFLPPANLPSLLLGLATSALLHLGETPDSSQLSQGINLPAAKQAIDLLALLEIKTRGNLDKEEEALLRTLLYDLRLKYVKASK
ncbi:MAG: DUF1844 domain-containing protein [Candidatus Adiutrix intracellularis]|nr:DUF1844 domain-containing protein [Candidatus Adiutrix intracellularis]